jgi:hypothetical protein
MTTERAARRALNNFPKAIMQFNDFVGLGVIPDENEGGDSMVVAIYVACDPSQLPPPMLDIIPEYLPTRPGLPKVKTKVVSIGEMEP